MHVEHKSKDFNFYWAQMNSLGNMMPCNLFAKSSKGHHPGALGGGGEFHIYRLG